MNNSCATKTTFSCSDKARIERMHNAFAEICYDDCIHGTTLGYGDVKSFVKAYFPLVEDSDLQRLALKGNVVEVGDILSEMIDGADPIYSFEVTSETSGAGISILWQTIVDIFYPTVRFTSKAENELGEETPTYSGTGFSLYLPPIDLFQMDVPKRSHSNVQWHKP